MAQLIIEAIVTDPVIERGLAVICVISVTWAVYRTFRLIQR